MRAGSFNAAAGLACLLLGTSLSYSALAQTTPAPDAGRTLQELRAQPAPTEQKQAPGLLKDATPATKPGSESADAPKVLIKAVQVSGSKAFPAAELEALVKDLPEHEWTLGQLRVAAGRITDYYHAHGYLLARAYLPAQDISNGSLTIAVIEGWLEKTEIQNGSRLDDARLKEMIDAQLIPGQPIQSDAANRALLLLQSLPGVTKVDGSLKPGTEVGTTDLDIAVQGRKLVSGYIGADNSGNRYTGKTRLTANVNLDDATGWGDQLSVQSILGGNLGTDDLMQYGRAAWDIPLGNDGVRWGAAYSKLHYELGGRFASLDGSGFARTSSFYSSYPLLLTPVSHINLGLSYERRAMHDEQDAVSFATDRDIDALLLTSDGHFQDAALGSAASTTLSLSLTSGLLQLQTDSVAAIDASTAQTDGHYLKALFNVTRQQLLPAHFSLYLSSTIQRSDKNLDSSEQFFLGGPTRVRAYPSGEAPGDEGWVVTAELRHPMLSFLEAVAFYDGGIVDINHSPYIAQDNVLRRCGAGVGANAYWKGFTLKSSLAWRVGSPAATSDVDKIPQLWIATQYQF